VAALVCSPALPTLTSQVTIYSWSTKELLVLATLARWLQEAGGRVAPDPAVMALAATLLRQPADQPLDIGQLIESVRAGVEQFGGRARESVSQPIPDEREARAAFSSFLQILLDVTISLLTNLLVAAAWTLTAVQDAAHRAALDTVEVAGRAVDYVGHAWPSLVAVSALAVEAAASVGIARQAWESIRPLPEPTLASPIDDRGQTPVTRTTVDDAEPERSSQLPSRQSRPGDRAGRPPRAPSRSMTKAGPAQLPRSQDSSIAREGVDDSGRAGRSKVRRGRYHQTPDGRTAPADDRDREHRERAEGPVAGISKPPTIEQPRGRNARVRARAKARG
jgi:hypothetical protein